ncbi:hypothetical protein [Andreprevotia chitinilytica]|uniref:hypothetical protein n=1 Tax=Andreprevotia chitinilytica TaxID=396808 RepID=UPI000551FABD|nr:hypothetical protein [Andreprevotia chitinilytica]
MPQATKIMIVRHAEKPADTGAPYGVAIDGTQDAESLIVRGWQRAGALAVLFAPSHGPLQNTGLAQPQALFASGIAKHSESMRPQETLTPLSQKLGIEINTGCLKGQESQVAAQAVATAGIVLIGWEHQNIPLIANAIVGNDTTVPQSWPGDRFDIVWVFDLDSSGNYAFSQVPQQVLAGDLPTVI